MADIRCSRCGHIAFPAGVFAKEYKTWNGKIVCDSCYSELIRGEAAEEEIKRKAEETAAEKERNDEENFHGIIINSVEVGTNLLGWVRGVDRENGLSPVSAKFTFTNKTGKEIKYITVGVRPYNAVGDPVACSVRGVSLYNVKCTGPFVPDGRYTGILEDSWYNISIESIRIESAQIVYMDNSTENLAAAQIRYISNDKVLTDNESRVVRVGFGKILTAISGIIDIISIIGIFTMSVEVFSALLVISSIAFFIGLKMRHYS